MSAFLRWIFLAGVLTICIIGTEALRAQEIQFTAVAKQVVTVGERFQLQYRFNAEGTGFKGPEINDFIVLSGPVTSTSTSVQIIGGQVSREVSYTFTYVLMADKEGTFTIPPATITFGKTQFTSNPVTIQVKAATPPPGQTTPQREMDQQGKTEDIDVFLRAEISNSSPYLGEQVIISYKLYFNNQIAGHDGFQKIGSFPGFWVKDLLANRKDIPTQTEMFRGKQYNVAEVRRFALFPQRTGQIEISPQETELTIRLRTEARRRTSDPFLDMFFNDPFFSSRYIDVNRKIQSNSITINVKPLPSKDRPDGFGGAVGKFSVKSEISQTEAKSNEPITIQLTIQGSGNLELFDIPRFNFPPDFEVYDPEIRSDIKTSTSGVSGSRTFEYLIIPRNPGTFRIPPLEFSYFDPDAGIYQVHRTPEYTLNIQRGEGSGNVVTYTGPVRQEGIQFIGTDIRHIKLPPYNLKPLGTFFFRSQQYYLMLLLPLLVFVTAVIIWQREMKKRSNQALMKNLRATRVASKRLKQAGKFLQQGKEDEFYEEISRALWGYISDKMNIPLAELSLENVETKLLSRGIPEEFIKEFTETLQQTEYARFAPGEKTENMERLYNSALQVITKIEKHLR